MDGGETWEVQFSTEEALFNLHFIDKETGWIVGDQAEYLCHKLTVDRLGNTSHTAATNGTKAATGSQNISEMNRFTPLHFTISTLRIPKTAGLSGT